MSIPVPLEKLLDHVARDYREMAMGWGPLVPDGSACWEMADRLAAAAARLRREVEFQTFVGADSNLDTLARVRGE